MHPIICDLGFWQLRSYGLLNAIAFLAGVLLLLKLNRRAGRSDEVALDLAVWAIVSGLVGARLLYVLVNPQEFADRPQDIIAIWKGGQVFFGGLIGGGLGVYWWLRRKKLPVWAVADDLAPALALGQVFGRIGCFLNGCCYGRVSDTCGLHFPGLLDNLPHLPTQLYESGFTLGLVVFLLWFLKRKTYAGQVFWAYVALYSVGRFVIEHFRGDSERGALISDLLSPAQWISLVGLALAVWFLITRRKATKNAKDK